MPFHALTPLRPHATWSSSRRGRRLRRGAVVFALTLAPLTLSACGSSPSSGNTTTTLAPGY